MGVTALETDGIASKRYSDFIANALAIHLLYRYSTYKSSFRHYARRLSHQQLTQVINYINEHLDRNLSLTELASLTQLSPYHFARLFKQFTGIAPHQYYIHCRSVSLAKDILTIISSVASG